MKNLIVVAITIFSLMFALSYLDSKRDPYEEGMHMNYTIQCENGFVYKILPHGHGTIQVLNSDGTPLKCGKKKY